MNKPTHLSPRYASASFSRHVISLLRHSISSWRNITMVATDAASRSSIIATKHQASLRRLHLCFWSKYVASRYATVGTRAYSTENQNPFQILVFFGTLRDIFCYVCDAAILGGDRSSFSSSGGSTCFVLRSMLGASRK
jgi:hypothetical protein